MLQYIPFLKNLDFEAIYMSLNEMVLYYKLGFCWSEKS